MLEEKTTELGASAVRTTFWLSTGLTTSTIISAIAMILIARLLGPAGYGIYSAALAPVSIIGLFRDWGTNVAITRYVAYYRSEASLRASYMRSAVFFEFLSGGLISILLFVFSKHIAIYVLKKPEVDLLISIASIIVLTTGLGAVANGFLLGIERADIIGFLLVFFSIFRNSLALVLILFGWGSLGAVIGQTIGFSLNGISSFIIAIFIAKPRGKVLEPLKDMLSYGLPYAVVLIMTGLSMRLYNLIAARMLEYGDYGAFAAAFNVFTSLMGILGTITTGFLPSFSRINTNDIPQIFEKAVKYTSFLIAPLITVLITTAQPLMTIVFGSEYAEAGGYFTLMAITYLTSIFGIQVINSILLGLAETKTIAKIWIPALGVGVGLVVYVASILGAYGLITSIIITYSVASFLGLMVMRNYNATISAKFTLKILLIILLAIFAGLWSRCSLNVYMNFIISLVVTTLVYLIALIAIRPLEITEIAEITKYVRSVPILGRVLSKILSIYCFLAFKFKISS